MIARVVLVGMGVWGCDWATNVLPVVEGIDVVAAVDIDESKLIAAQEAGLIAPDMPTFTDLAEALRHVEADAVLITAAIVAHAELVMTALEAGCHVHVEKPFTTTLADAVSAVELATARGLTLAVVQNFRYEAPFTIATRMARERVFGDLTGVWVDFRRLYPFDDTLTPHPEIDHNVLVQISVHHFDLMRAVIGREPRSIYCHAWKAAPSTSSAPCAATAVVDFDGLVVTYRADMMSQGDETSWAGSWRLECTDGDILWGGADHPLDGMTFEYDQRSGGFLELHPRGKAPQRQPLPATIEARLFSFEEFIRAVAMRSDLPVSGRNNLGTIALMNAAELSARTGRTVLLDEIWADVGQAVG